MADKRWKRHEREKCRALGGERTGPRGFGLPDCVGLEVALEVKSYKRFVFLTKDWEQAVENAERVGKPPVLAVREAGRGGRDCVQMWWGQFNVWGREDIEVDGQIVIPKKGPALIRFPWNDFVRLYRALVRAAYNIDNKETPVG
jgi:hypothetical protein